MCYQASARGKTAGAIRGRSEGVKRAIVIAFWGCRPLAAPKAFRFDHYFDHHRGANGITQQQSERPGFIGHSTQPHTASNSLTLKSDPRV